MEIYDLTSRQYIEQLQAVDNLFIRQLFILSCNAAKQNKMLTILSDNLIRDNSITSANLSNISDCTMNICDLPPLLDKVNCKSIVEDIAKYRWSKLNFQYDDNFWKERTNLLFLDYILSACFCYVEIFDLTSTGKRSNMVEKFYATRNRFIAAKVANIPVDETSKYINYLSPILPDYKMESLRVLKLSHSRKGYKISQPRSSINFTRMVKVTPLFFISSFLQGLSPLLKDNIVKFTYVKDNGQEREIYTTLSKDIFKKYYDDTYIDNIMSKVELKMDRGYLKIPELGCSKYDDTGLRALNLTRITHIDVVDSFDTSYINVDFKNIIPTFKATVEAINNKEAIYYIYMALIGKEPSDAKDIIKMRSDIMSYVDGRFAIGTTTFQKELHNFMLKYKMIFKGYTGLPVQADNNDIINSNSTFNLGFE